MALCFLPLGAQWTLPRIPPALLNPSGAWLTDTRMSVHRLPSILRLASRTFWPMFDLKWRLHTVSPQIERVMFRDLKYDILYRSIPMVSYPYCAHIILSLYFLLSQSTKIYISLTRTPPTAYLSVLPWEWVTTIPIPVYLLCSTDLYNICICLSVLRCVWRIQVQNGCRPAPLAATQTFWMTDRKEL